MATLYIASYGTDQTGIYVFGFDPLTAKFSFKKMILTEEVPAYLILWQNELAACFKNGGGLQLFSLSENGAPSVSLPQPGISYTHLDLSKNGLYLAAADYHQGATDLFKREDGKLSKLDRLSHSGSGPDPVRQNKPYVHCVAFSPNASHLLAADLGSDLIRAFHYKNGKLEPDPKLTVSIRPGAGPRHLVFSKDGHFLYLVNELDNTVDVFKCEAGILRLLQTISCLNDPKSASTAGAIRLSQSEKTLIVTNRGCDSLAYFDRDLNTGRLALLDIVSCKKHPRDAFILDDAFIFVAALEEDALQLFFLDEAKKEIRPSDAVVHVPKPVSLVVSPH